MITYSELVYNPETATNFALKLHVLDKAYRLKCDLTPG